MPEVTTIEARGSSDRTTEAAGSYEPTLAAVGSSTGLHGEFERSEFEPTEFLTDEAIELSGSRGST